MVSKKVSRPKKTREEGEGVGETLIHRKLRIKRNICLVTQLAFSRLLQNSSFLLKSLSGSV